MFVYDITKNHVFEMSITEIAELVGKTASAISRSCSRKSVIEPYNYAIFKTSPTIEQKREMYARVTFPDEVWQVIKGSDGKFKISNYGRVKRVCKNGEKFLLPYIKKRTGNMKIKVQFNGVYKIHRVKDLVAAHYLRKPKPGEVLCHANGDKTDDYAGNLKWTTRQKLGQKTAFKSKSKEIVQLDPQTYEIIAEFRSSREAGRNTPYSHQSICDYCNGKHKNHYGDVFMWRNEYEQMKEVAN